MSHRHQRQQRNGIDASGVSMATKYKAVARHSEAKAKNFGLKAKA